MSFRFVPLVVTAAAAVGCSAPVVDDIADASGSMTEAVVVVERQSATDATGQTGQAAQTTISAKFMRLSAPVDPELAERVVGSRLDLPPVGSCRVAAGDSDWLGGSLGGSAAARTSRGTIELIDVGDLTLRARTDADPSSGAQRIPLAVRAFPEVGDLVSGMFYSSPDTAVDLGGSAVYTLEGSGAGTVERFAVDIDAPGTLDDVRIGGLALTDGVALADGAPAAVAWRAPEVKATSDVVYLDVRPQKASSVRCSFEDTGSATLPTWVVSRAVQGASVELHRVRVRAFSAAGVDTGEARFDVAVTGRVTLARAE